MDEQDINVTDVIIAYKTRKKMSSSDEASKKSFSCLDKKYRLREYDKTSVKCYNFHKEKTYQQERIKPCIFVKFAMKIQITIWIKTLSNELHSTSTGRNCRYYFTRGRHIT